MECQSYEDNFITIRISKHTFLADFAREKNIEKRLFVYIPFCIVRYEKEIASGSSVGQAEQGLEYFRQEMLRLIEIGCLKCLVL